MKKQDDTDSILEVWDPLFRISCIPDSSLNSGFREMVKLSLSLNEWYVASPPQFKSHPARPCIQALIPKAERRRLCSRGLSRVAGGGANN
jgi:hypothetical protein